MIYVVVQILVQENKELKLHVESLRQELADQLKEHNRQIETNFARHEASTQELSTKYEQKLAAVAKEADDQHKQVLEEVHAEYAVKIAELRRTHEAQLELSLIHI